MRLTVLNVAFPRAPVSPDTVGGAEQVLSQIDRALVEEGHRSRVLACEGSRVAGELIEALDFDADVLHFHGIDFYEYLPEDGPPALVTLHLPPDWYPASIWRNDRAHLHCVSHSQQKRCPEGAKLWPVIDNGVDLDAFRPRFHKFPFALMLGRICPEKGFHLALDAASHAGIPLWIGGEVYPYEAHIRYFEEQVKPRLEGTRHRFLGPLGQARKKHLLRAAKCVLIPSLAPETSSLVAMEAFASGTPVIAFRSGALPELVGRTGILVNDACEMAEAINQVDRISPVECRREAEQRFSLKHTTVAYIATYRKLFQDEWQQLYENCPTATPFASPDWMLAREEIFGDLAFVRARRNGHLVAIAAVGEGGAHISDYRDVLAIDKEAASQLWEELPPCTLDEIPPDSTFLGVAQNIEDASWCPVTLLDGFKPGGTKKRKQMGAISEIATPEQAPEYLAALFDLHERRWQGEGVLKDPRVRAFHQRVTRAFAARGWLRFHGLRVDGKLKAVLYAFARNGRVYYYLSGFDPEFEPFSPGSLLIQDAMSQGDREFDFLRGTEPYKYKWGAVNRINQRVRKTA